MKKLFNSLFIFFAFLLFSCLVSCSFECKHKEVIKTVVAPTCTQRGYTENKCLDCGQSFMTDETDPMGHKLTAFTYEATCDTQGFTVNECDCGYEFVSDYIPPFGHTFIDTKISPKCDEIGYTLHECNSCDFEYADSYLKATGHTYVKYTVAPTCTKQGYTVYACVCGFSYESDYQKALGHSLTEAVTEPTCTSEGYTEYTCFCGYSYKSDYTEIVAHKFVDQVTIDPTCTEAGYTTYTCECGYAYRSDPVDPTGHRYASIVTNATCSEAGYTTKTCECGDTYISDIVSALGHDFTKNIVMPTVSDMGYTEYTCGRCDFEYVGAYRFYSEILPNGAYAANDTVLANGIDISKWNHPTTPAGEFLPLDWNAIKAEGIDYVILKAGSTRSGEEPTFDLDYSDAKAAGVDVGVYFYTYATNVAQIKADAEFLVSILDGKQFEYPIYLDLEDDSLLDVEPSILTEMCVTFISILQKNGYYAGLYVNHEWLYNILQTEKMLDMFEIWYARYPQNVTEYVWNTKEYGEHLGMWQYTDKGRLDAIPEIDIDLNYAYKDYPAIIKALGKPTVD